MYKNILLRYATLYVKKGFILNNKVPTHTYMYVVNIILNSILINL